MKLKSKKTYLSLIVTGICLFFAAPILHAATVYIDPSVGTNCINAYNPVTRTCQGGSDSAYANLGQGLAAVAPGDTVLLRAGSYGQLAPPASGEPGKPITIKSYPGEIAAISNLGSVALWIIEKSDLVIDGLQVQNVVGFGRLEESERITIKNITFSSSTASGTTGGLKLVRSSFNAIFDNSFEDGSDIMILQDASDRNLIAGNSFYQASHSLISIRCSNYNVIRENTFLNPDQKAVEIYDCEGVSDAPVRYDATKRNLIEKNAFVGTKSYYKDYYYNAIQHGAQQTIVRNNLFRDCLGGGVNYQYYADECRYVYENRMYNNTFVNNQCYGIIGASGSASIFYDNRVRNNLLYQNTDCSGGGSSQVKIASSDLVILENNVMAESDPGFSDAANDNFNLVASSPNIDAGMFVATTVGAGSGTAIPVDDAGYFYDGYGIEGEKGDSIQIEGQSTRARIVDIDYGANTLIVDSPLSWEAGRGVHLAYAGAKPDVGAYEFAAGDSSQPPLPPANVKVVE